MIKLIVLQYWNTESYPCHNSYRVATYRDSKFASTGRACDSKAEVIAYIDGLQQAFRMFGELCEIEYVDSQGESGNYCDIFLSNNEYVEYGSGRDDREDFHSDG